MNLRFRDIFLCLLFGLCIPFIVSAQIVGSGAAPLSQVEVFFSPQTASYLEGSSFDIPIFINTHDESINTITLRVQFDPSKIRIINPSGGRSIIGLWVHPPLYDNVRGTLELSGVIPGGMKTESGLIATLTFKALLPGQASVRFQQDSSILLNDGLGTEATVQYARGTYDVVPKPPEGVTVYSDTHPSPISWYNERNPVIRWDNVPGVDGYSYVFDTKPSTVPENTTLTKDTFTAFNAVQDGVWYFHLKAFKRGVWGGTTHFAVRVDTTEPEAFEPTIGSSFLNGEWRNFVTFATTDGQSGIDRYEVGVVGPSSTRDALPVFIESESPYQLPPGSVSQVTVRAFDKAGNVRAVSIPISSRSFAFAAFKNYTVSILALVLVLVLASMGYHYFFRHHFLARFKRAVDVFEAGDNDTGGVKQGEVPPAGGSTTTTGFVSPPPFKPPEKE